MAGTLTTGSLLSGRYRIVQLMGEGGFGAVYRANDERFQGARDVAIKTTFERTILPLAIDIGTTIYQAVKERKAGGTTGNGSGMEQAPPYAGDE